TEALEAVSPSAPTILAVLAPAPRWLGYAHWFMLALIVGAVSFLALAHIEERTSAPAVFDSASNQLIACLPLNSLTSVHAGQALWFMPNSGLEPQRGTVTAVNIAAIGEIAVNPCAFRERAERQILITGSIMTSSSQALGGVIAG